jgi:hypothetical protein
MTPRAINENAPPSVPLTASGLSSLRGGLGSLSGGVGAGALLK